MSNNNTELMILPADQPLPEARQKSWLLLGAGKMKLDAELQKRELELQTITDLAQYKTMWNDLVAYRKKFTGYIDNIKDQCMAVEKRMDPSTNERYQGLVKADLDARLEKQKEEQKRAEAIREFAAFKAHLSNELADQSFTYEKECRGIINAQYAMVLESDPTKIDIVEEIAQVEAMLRTVKKQPLKKFQRTHVDDTAAKTIYAELVGQYPPFDFLPYLHEKFSMYENDKANARAIIEAEEIQNKAQEAEALAALEQQKATTILVAQADSYVVDEVLVKTTRSIKIQDDSERWVMAIMSAFISNFREAFPKIRNKKYSSLSIAQMASALDAASIEVKGIDYVTSHK